MKIGIIGSGNIGGNLGKHWAASGHEVMFSSRNPETLKSMADEVGARTGTPQEAASFGEVILLAIPFGKVPDLATQIGSLDNKILIDAGNPYPHRDGDVAQKVIDDESQTATGYVADQFRGAKTVKAFNSIYYKVLAEKAFLEGDERIAVQVCSDDEQAKETVKQLIKDIGFAPQDLGKLDKGVLFEPDAALYNQNLKIGEAEKLLSQIQ
ncbi:putative dinucleotide-binding enzyme [Rivularia sp. PCC 7116]|uniref:NADPH-dependent F420 reductase n=1 Tax=Rivularia sp. PCC 7116 TaxID=373994 RepID=UPI00029EE43D|nr:NAD(P)-binding domain-containing protein [Rivularia sp. PCC 7116]AFY58478.1 putative dinucleotide-binding enzyme [Rivularia sp. PCC 7116]